jgi:hypothetical protein
VYRAALLIPVVLVAVAGCGGSKETAGASPAPSAPRSAASVPATPTPGPAAKDGTDLAVCHKRTCEVLVAKGDVIHPPGRARVAKLTVTSVTSTRVAYLGTGPGITLTMSGQRPGSTARMNALTVTTVAIVGQRAIVRFAAK